MSVDQKEKEGVQSTKNVDENKERGEGRKRSQDRPADERKRADDRKPSRPRKGRRPSGSKSQAPAGKQNEQTGTRVAGAKSVPLPSMTKPGGGGENGNGNGTPSDQPRGGSRPPKSERSERSETREGRGASKTGDRRHRTGSRGGAARGRGGADRPPAERTKVGTPDIPVEAEKRPGGASKKSKGGAKQKVGHQAMRKKELEQDYRDLPTTKKKAASEPVQPKELVLPAAITIRDLSTMMGVSPIDVIKELMNNGVMANINQPIDFDTAAIVAGELGFTVAEEKAPEEEKEEVKEEPKTLRQIICETTDPSMLEDRPPVVTVLGHVDHGKTTLLDAIRHTQVVDTEAGGITQRIGAYQVDVDGRKITFLDTPGHEAFTAMRARGAQVTDLAVLVVAADDGVMPQTREAIDHARAAKVPILVAMNKVDKPNANPELLKQQLADIGLVVEDWGGDVICVPVSAKFQQGIDDLLENILLVTEVAELKANPNCPAIGTVVEGRLDRARGVAVTLLVQNGTLHVGDNLVAGDIYGRVRAMFDDKGQTVEAAPPSVPVAILGLSEVPQAGDVFEVYASEREARSVATARADARKAAATQPHAKILSLDDMASQIKAGQIKELNVILKADVQGSIEPIVNSLEQLGDEDLRVKILHTGTGNISESDIMLAAASQTLVIGFSVDADSAAQRLAEQEGIDIRRYDVIYTLIEDIERALSGLREPVYEEMVTAHADVRAVFRIPKTGNIAGSYVTDGTVGRDNRVRVFREGEQIFDGGLSSLKHLKDDVKEVATGFEFGVGISGFNDIQEGDKLEFYKKVRVS